MARAKGANAYLAFDEETTYGSDPVTPNATSLIFKNESIACKQELLMDDSLTGNRNQPTPIAGALDVGGSINVNLSETAHAKLFKHLLGAVTTTGAGDPYTHTIKVGSSLPVGLVIERGYSDIAQYFKYNGCRISKGSFKFGPKALAEGTFEIVGKKETVSGTAYDSTITAVAYSAFNGLNIAIQEGGATLGIASEAELSIDNQLDTDGYVMDGTGMRADLPEGQVVVTGKLKAFFENATLLNKAINKTESSLKITLDKSVTPLRSIEFFIPELHYERTTPTVDGPKGIFVNLSFKGFYNNSAEASSLQVILKNGLATI